MGPDSVIGPGIAGLDSTMTGGLLSPPSELSTSAGTGITQAPIPHIKTTRARRPICWG